MPKSLYKIVFMYQRECLIRYRYAFSDKQARTVAIKGIADEQGIDPRVVFGYFKDRPGSVTVSIETEFKEVSDGNNS